MRRLQAALAPEPDRISIEVALASSELGIEQAVPLWLDPERIAHQRLQVCLRRPNARQDRRLVPGIRHRNARALRGRRRGRNAVDQRNEPKNEPNNEPNNEPKEQSLGLRIIEVLARQLDGTWSREPGAGTRMVLRFPVAHPQVSDNKAQCAH